MYDRILSRMRQKVFAGQYIVTQHAIKEMSADNLTVYDVESAILTGQILERQRDRQTSERKYRIRGKSLADDDTELVAKMAMNGYLVIITVYVP